MTTAHNLVLIHGRDQEGREPSKLKGEWLEALDAGLLEAGAALRLTGANLDIRFPFYGDTLAELVRRSTEESVPPVVLRSHSEDGVDVDDDAARFVCSVLAEMTTAANMPDAPMHNGDDASERRRGALRSRLPYLLRVIDNYAPSVGAQSIALFARDVYRYLSDSTVRDRIDSGVAAAINALEPTTIVAHSLGSVVAYSLLERQGVARGWKIPVFVTLGSPLGITAIRRVVRASFPGCIGSWLNARDERDLVALFPLDGSHFDVAPARIVNKNDVRNSTANYHGISGYLRDTGVAKWVYDAVIS